MSSPSTDTGPADEGFFTESDHTAASIGSEFGTKDPLLA